MIDNRGSNTGETTSMEIWSHARPAESSGVYFDTCNTGGVAYHMRCVGHKSNRDNKKLL
jgi:hypothetical protein